MQRIHRIRDRNVKFSAGQDYDSDSYKHGITAIRAMLRRFAPAKGEAHTDFRKVIREQVNTVLKILAYREAPPFFHMP